MTIKNNTVAVAAIALGIFGFVAAGSASAQNLVQKTNTKVTHALDKTNKKVTHAADKAGHATAYSTNKDKSQTSIATHRALGKNSVITKPSGKKVIVHPGGTKTPLVKKGSSSPSRLLSRPLKWAATTSEVSVAAQSASPETHTICDRPPPQ